MFSHFPCHAVIVARGSGCDASPPVLVNRLPTLVAILILNTDSKAFTASAACNVTPKSPETSHTSRQPMQMGVLSACRGQAPALRSRRPRKFEKNRPRRLKSLGPLNGTELTRLRIRMRAAVPMEPHYHIRHSYRGRMGQVRRTSCFGTPPAVCGAARPHLQILLSVRYSVRTAFA
ncbi:hypothetical protein B0H21DRAFT_378568 [Amylocystis lapponica]|nr:hypothetical protein B0H21DRAFT_378568 [Amylocystis lapponica]